MELLKEATDPTTGAWFEIPTPGNVDISHVRSWFLQGVLGVGGTVVIEASQVTYGTTPTARQTSVVTTLTALGITNTSVRARQIRASVTGGDGTTDLDLTGV